MSSVVKDVANTVWLNDADSGLTELEALSALQTSASSVPMATDIVHHIPVYDGSMVRELADAQASGPQGVKRLQEEWVNVWLNGAGVVVIRNAIDDLDMLDQVTAALTQIIDEESQRGTAADHFAAAGANSRLWNSHEKLCLHSPELFARYTANDVIELACRAWLGPAYQITAQANIVHPGGKAQRSHRDYHMGFQEAALLSQYPAHVHAMSPMLTLQGGIAHSDVPLDSGPTQLLPFSQRLLSGYLSAASEPVREYFLQNYVQLPLNKGDMVFFSPALMHAAGDNKTSDHHRFVNLLQVGSAYGRTMELLDRTRMCMALYPVLLSLQADKTLSERAICQAVQACAEGYAFPANMDLQPPVGGLAPQSQQELMMRALHDGMPSEEFSRLVLQQQGLKRSC